MPRHALPGQSTSGHAAPAEALTTAASMIPADVEYLQVAVQMAHRSVGAGGAPFGSVAVRDGLVLGIGTNEVTRTFDPTAHAEVVAVRAACRRLGRTDLSDCVLYSSCEPCPLCLTVAHWARIPRVVYAAGRQHAIAAGCADETLYEAFRVPAAARSLLTQVEVGHSALAPFQEWQGAARAG